MLWVEGQQSVSHQASHEPVARLLGTNEPAAPNWLVDRSIRCLTPLGWAGSSSYGQAPWPLHVCACAVDAGAASIDDRLQTCMSKAPLPILEHTRGSRRFDLLSFFLRATRLDTFAPLVCAPLRSINRDRPMTTQRGPDESIEPGTPRNEGPTIPKQAPSNK